jgi:surfeit locus 1 family protein
MIYQFSKKYMFNFHFWPTTFALLVFALLIILGNWQLHRYTQKKNLLNQISLIKQSPIIFKGENNLKNFTAISVEGNFLTETPFLLENQFQNEQPGIDLLLPFKIKSDHSFILVDLGFIPKKSSKSNLIDPQFNTLQKITGYVKYPEKSGFILGAPILNPGKWPLHIQQIDITNLSTLLNKPLIPFIIRLDKNNPGDYERNWILSNVLPARHLGYAIQWFIMAISLVFIFLFFSLCKNKTEQA